MSIQVGKSSRFTTANQKAQANVGSPFKSRLRDKQLATSLPPLAYRRIKVGPELSLEFEDAQALPVDGSKNLLRNLSPFLVQVELPLAFANDPKTSGKGKAVGIFDAAYKGLNSTQGGSPSDQNGFLWDNSMKGDPQEVLARKAPNPQINKSGDGNQTLSDNGQTSVGKLGNPSIAGLEQALDIVTQLASIQQSPPLVMLINPNNLTMNYSRIHQFSDRSRTGYIYQAWGEEQPRMSIAAKCGAFMSGGRGLQFASKRDSASWQNLMTLFQLYRSNGYIYDTLGKSNAHLFVGGLSIHYDGWIYYGNMESFSWTHDDSATQLGGVEFQMEFVVSVMVDTSMQTQTVLPMKSPHPHPNDPRLRSSPAARRTGGNTLSVNLVDEVRQVIFGKGSSAAPAERATPANQGFGDPDFTGTTRLPVQGNLAAVTGGGFQAVVTAPDNGVTQLTARPEPFRRS
jgi:hypothetical protein